MPNIPTASYFVDGDRTKAEMKTSFEDWLAAHRLTIGMDAPCEILAPANDQIVIGTTPNQGGVEPDPPSCVVLLGTASTSEVTSIDASALPDNTLVLFKFSASSPMPGSYVLLVDDGVTAGRPRLKGIASTKTFAVYGESESAILFYLDGGVLYEVMRDYGVNTRIVMESQALTDILANDNPSLETNNTTNWANIVGGSSVFNSTSYAHTGSRSLKSGSAAGNVSTTRYTIPEALLANQPYTFSVWARTASATPISNMVATVYNTVATAFGYVASVSVDIGTATWTKIEVTFVPTVAGSGYMVYLSMGLATGSYVYFDDLSCTYEVTPTGWSGNELTGKKVSAQEVALSHSDDSTYLTAAMLRQSANFRVVNTLRMCGAAYLPGTMTAADATPSVANLSCLKTTDNGTTPCAITMFDDGVVGQRLIVISTGAYVTVTDGGNLKLAGNWTPGEGDTLSLIFDGTDWYETGRSDN